MVATTPPIVFGARLPRTVAVLPTDGLFGAIAEVAVIVAALLFLSILIALIAFIVKSVRGDGIEWPEDTEEKSSDDADDGVVEREDGEWKYY